MTFLSDLLSIRKAVCCVQVQSKFVFEQEASSQERGCPLASTGVRSASLQGFFQPRGAPRIHFTFLSRPILMTAH